MVSYVSHPPSYENEELHQYQYYSPASKPKANIRLSNLETKSLSYKTEIPYKKVEDDFFRHIPSLPIQWLRDEQIPGILGMTYINSNYIILRESLRDQGMKKLEVEVHEAKHQMDRTNPEWRIRENTKNMFKETYYH